MSDSIYPGFEQLRSKTIEALNITIVEYQHTATGAQHIHVAADNAENTFLVALRTVPEDSTGVAHILEHTALCGSKKYPVRDPFFMMIRRSLNTFMNAMTSSDWTAYPFASQNRKDFDNLLDVYLDAVFFSRLDPLDFAQEGHRLEFVEPDNSDTELMYKGVVYNEMKGAMSSVVSQLWQRLNHHIFPTNTYHYNSGGEPVDIPKLSYEQLKHFYETHYHPSNAIFMTFGDIPAVEHQEKFTTEVLNHFKPLDKTIQVHAEQRYSAPINIKESYAYTPTEGEDPEKQSHIAMGWLLGKSTDLKGNLEVHLLSSLLYDNSASPLQHLLETSSLGTSPSPLCGIDDSQYEMLFMCGLQGCGANDADAFEDQIENLLNKLATEGLPQEQLEASLHQLELQQREIGGDGYPYGLQLLMHALSPATHRGDILSFMDLEAALQSLQEDIKDRDYIPKLIKRLLVNNTHRVTLTLAPDTQKQQAEIDAEKSTLASIKATLTENEKQQIIQQAKRLEERQQQEEDMDILPKVDLTDIPAAKPSPQGSSYSIHNQHPDLTAYTAGTNGLVYQQIALRLPALSEQELHILPYYTLCLTDMGIGDQDYLQVQQRQSEIVGLLNSYFSLRNSVNDPNQYHMYLTFTANALHKNQQAMTELMNDTLLSVNFDNPNRIAELLAQAKAGKEQSIVGNGHSYAMQAATANLNSVALASQNLLGMRSFQALKTCHQNIQSHGADELITQLHSLHQKLLQAEKHTILVTEQQKLEQHIHHIQQGLERCLNLPTNSSGLILPPATGESCQQAWITNAQVHYCAKVYPTVPMNHPDAAKLCVLGGVLRNGFLHRTIREQGGAYGGGASQDSNSSSFRFYSYRDPRMADTLEDFDKAIDWLNTTSISEEQVEESILSLIGSLDKPGSPAGEAKQAFHANFTGRNDEVRDRFRQGVIETTAEDLKRVANTYLTVDNANTAVVTGKHGVAEAEKCQLEIVEL